MYIVQRADILGYPTHAAFVLEMRMAKTPEKVKSFEEELAKKLKSLKDREMQLFLKYKKKEVSGNTPHPFLQTQTVISGGVSLLVSCG